MEDNIIKLLPWTIIPDPASAKAHQDEANRKDEANQVEVEKSDELLAQREAAGQALKDALRTLRKLDPQFTDQARTLRCEIRDELIATGEACDIAAYMTRLQIAEASARFVIATIDDVITLRLPLAELQILEASANRQHAVANKLDSAAFKQYVATVATLGAAFESEGGVLGVIGPRTSALLAEAAEAHKLAGVLDQTLRERRARFDEMQRARISSGLITSANVARAIPR